jgi:DNA-binding beta-propeller fold protein YncE
MFKKLIFLSLMIVSTHARSDVSVSKIDFLPLSGVAVNAAGPLLVQLDGTRNRLVVANTLSSSISIIDCESRSVVNIPLAGRALQHLKSEAMTIRKKTGQIYLIGVRCIHIITPEKNSSRTIRTGEQYESIAVDDEYGNVFVVGRESKSLGFLPASSMKLKQRKWLDWREDLINLNATPPPPIRKVIADKTLGQILAVDGITSILYVFDAKSGKQVSSRPIGLAKGGRWHLAGYDERSHCLYLITETSERKVTEAAKIDVVHGNDVIVQLPQYTEGVGITYNPVRDEVYIPYDNHASVHVVTFTNGGCIEEIAIPAYGNDASAIDVDNDVLYIASWAFGEIDVIDVKTRKLKKRVTGLGIIPHMFAMAYNPRSGLIYFPKGATAVNGTFGAAITVLDPETETLDKIYTGWAPIDMIELESRNSFLVFNSEDHFAEAHADGSYEAFPLPYDYPVSAVHSPERDVYLSYGPHQSYWPTVYIWGAKNGILTIDKDDLGFYDRRIPRQAHKMQLDDNGVLYFTQNNWGREEQFLGTLEDQVRVYEANKRIRLGDEVEREITQRILRFDRDMHRFYLVRIGEKDEDPSMLQVIDQTDGTVVGKIQLGMTATDLLFDHRNIYVANFDSKSVSVIDGSDFSVSEIETGEQPLKLCRCGDGIFVIHHGGNTIREIRENGKTFKLPHKGLPDNCFTWNDGIIITSHSANLLHIIRFEPEREKFSILHEEEYPYGDTRFDSQNVSFYVRGQFGDGLFEITQGKEDKGGRFWITDFLSGKLFILEAE